MKGYVLDTSVLYYGKDLPQGFECVITPGVVRELDKEGMSARLELLMATRVRVSSPSDRSLRKVGEESEKTGDSRRLSEADKDRFESMFDSVGMAKPFFFCQDLGDPWQETWYVYITALEIIREYNRQFTIRLSLREAL